MTRPLDLSENRKLTMPLAFVMVLLGATYAFAVGYSRLVDTDASQGAKIIANTTELSDHETRIRQLESVNARIDQKLDRLIEIERQQARP